MSVQTLKSDAISEFVSKPRGCVDLVLRVVI